MSALTPLQERFCNEYLVDLNATRAALRAGYSEATNASALMAHEGVLARIEQLQEERAARLGVDQDWVVARLKLIADRCMDMEPISDKEGKQLFEFDEEGNLRPLVKFNATGATNAVKLLGQHIGMFTEKVEHSGSIDTGNVSDNELARRVAFLLQQAVRNRQRPQPEATTH